jgi:hypothetical protein
MYMVIVTTYVVIVIFSNTNRISMRIGLYMNWNFLIWHVKIGHGPKISENRDCKGHSMIDKYHHIYMCVKKGI